MLKVTPAMRSACDVVRDGGVLIYPTETLYAIGCSGLDARAAAKVYEFKQRDPSKPLPLLIGDASQLSMITDWRPDELIALAEKFWPGPLSILVPARAGLPREVQDRRGLTSVRVTPHPLAAQLSREAGVPLVATSANISGHPAVSLPQDLEAELRARVDFVLDEAPFPGGGSPSTVIGIEQGGRLRLYREGVITRQELRAEGFTTL